MLVATLYPAYTIHVISSLVLFITHPVATVHV